MYLQADPTPMPLGTERSLRRGGDIPRSTSASGRRRTAAGVRYSCSARSEGRHRPAFQQTAGNPGDGAGEDSAGLDVGRLRCGRGAVRLTITAIEGFHNTIVAHFPPRASLRVVSRPTGPESRAHRTIVRSGGGHMADSTATPPGAPSAEAGSNAAGPGPGNRARSRFRDSSTLTDAVVAIAITLLILPILDIDPPKANQTVFTVMGNNSRNVPGVLPLVRGGVTFWRREPRHAGRSPTPGVLVDHQTQSGCSGGVSQFPTEQLGNEWEFERLRAGGHPLCGTLAFISLIMWLMAEYLRRRPDLLENAADRLATGPDLIFAGEVVYPDHRRHHLLVRSVADAPGPARAGSVRDLGQAGGQTRPTARRRLGRWLPAVDIRDLRVSFGDVRAADGLTMTAPAGDNSRGRPERSGQDHDAGSARSSKAGFRPGEGARPRSAIRRGGTAPPGRCPRCRTVAFRPQRDHWRCCGHWPGSIAIRGIPGNCWTGWGSAMPVASTDGSAGRTAAGETGGSPHRTPGIGFPRRTQHGLDPESRRGMWALISALRGTASR